MKAESRLVIVFVIRLVFLAAAVWVVVGPNVLPVGSHWTLKAILAATLLVVSILIGEVATLHTQFEMFIRALRAAGLEVSEKDATKTDKEAVSILIRALGSREENTRKLAHRNLVRMTGQDLPPEKEVWEKWYGERRETEQAGPETDPE